MSQVQAKVIQDFTSRPRTQSSIQSSNPSLGGSVKSYSVNPTLVLNDGLTFYGNCESSPDMSKEIKNNQEALNYDELSPSQDFKTATILQLSSVSSLDFSNEIQSPCLQFALQQISSELQTSERSVFANSEYTSSSKLAPCAVRYQDFSPATKNAYHRKRAIEEIVETEEAYISSLKMLSGIYLDSLITQGSDGVPIRLLHFYIDVLISNHQSFLKDLNILFHFKTNSTTKYDFGSPGDRSKTESFLSSSSSLMAALVSQIMAQSAISLFLYQELSSIHDLVLTLMASRESDTEFTALTRGYQLFLEATQTSNGRMDLSFSSLIQKPISRIGKYKLFLENLLKLTPISEDPLCHEKIQQSLYHIDEQIKLVNRYGLQEKFKANLLFENLTFGSKTLKFPVEYLGLPILLGSLHCVWVGRDKQLQDLPFGAFLFKTHLVLASILKYNKYEVKFLIPLSICKIVESTGMVGGLFTNYPDSFKLIFEYRYTLIELLCLQYDEVEYEIWKDKLDVSVNFVNGPYSFDYSSSKINEEMGTHCSTIVPHYTQPFDANLNKVGSMRFNIFSQCYFSEILSITVEKIPINEDYGKYYRTINSVQSTGNKLIQLKEVERGIIEYLLQDLWSEELLCKATLTRREQSSIKKLGSKLQKHSSSRSLRSSFSKRHSSNSSNHQSNDNVDDDEEQVNLGSENATSVSTSRVSIFRRTSIVFSGALKSVMSSDH